MDIAVPTGHNSPILDGNITNIWKIPIIYKKIVFLENYKLYLLSYNWKLHFIFIQWYVLKVIVTVPIIPDYLFSHEAIQSANLSLDFRVVSLSPLQRKLEALVNENGPLGALLSSKAFVQLAFTPLVGYLIGIIGYNMTLFIGSCNMLIASIRKYYQYFLVDFSTILFSPHNFQIF